MSLEHKIFIFLLAITLLLGLAMALATTFREKPEFIGQSSDKTLCFIESNTLVGGYYPDEPEPIKVLLDKIITCESNWRNICNYDGCQFGMGLAQFIKSTWEETTERMGLDLNEVDVFNPEDNYNAALWLLKHDGDRHWKLYSGSCYLTN